MTCWSGSTPHSYFAFPPAEDGIGVIQNDYLLCIAVFCCTKWWIPIWEGKWVCPNDKRTVTQPAHDFPGLTNTLDLLGAELKPAVTKLQIEAWITNWFGFSADELKITFEE